MKAVRAGFLCMLLLLLMPSAYAQEARVDTVKVEITAESGIPSIVEERMQQSVQAIGEQLLLGKLISVVNAEKAAKERIVFEVFDKVLVGYSVDKVEIIPGSASKICVKLTPWKDCVESVEVECSIEGMAPEIAALVEKDLSGVDKVFEDALLGLPLAATDWTNGVMKRELYRFMEERLPEFRADFDVLPEEHTKVKLLIYPKLPVVRTINLCMRSDTIPNFTLLNDREYMEHQVNQLIGVPVPFVRRHQKELAERFVRGLDSQPCFRALKMHTSVDFLAAENMEIMSRSDSGYYRIRLEGWLDIGRHDEEDSINFRLHGGWKPSGVDEIFMQTDFMPKNVRCRWELGYARWLGFGLTANVRYDFNKAGLIAGFEQDLARDWLWRYEYRFEENLGEFGIRYRLHDFLNLEFVLNKDDRWLRVLGNF